MKINLFSLLCLSSLFIASPVLGTGVRISSGKSFSESSIEQNIDKGNFAKAYSQIQSSTYPKSTKDYFLAQYYGAVAKANWSTNQPIAKAYFQKLIEIYPNIDIQSDLLRSDYALALIRVEKDHQAALEILSQVIQNNPDFDEPYLNSYSANFQMQDFGEAYRNIKIYVDRFGSTDKNKSDLYKRYYGLIFTGIRSNQDVSSYYQTFKRIAPDNYLKSRLNMIGFAAQTVSDSDWIRTVSSDLIKLFPTSPEGYNKLISYYINEGEYQKAIEVNLKLLNKPGLEKASLYRSLVGLYTQTGQYTEGIQIAQQCLQEYGVDYLPCNYSLGTLYWVKGDFEQARDTYENIIQVLDKSKFLHGSSRKNVLLNTYAGLAKTYAELSDNQKALEHAQLSDDLYSPNADTLIARGIVYMNQGDLNQAKDYLQRGIDIYNTGSHFFPRSTADIAQNYYDSLD